MQLKLIKSNKISSLPRLILLSKQQSDSIDSYFPKLFSVDEKKYIAEQSAKEIDLFRLPRLNDDVFLHIIKATDAETDDFDIEYYSKGASIFKAVLKYKFEKIIVQSKTDSKKLLNYLEGFVLASYTFEKYKSEKNKPVLREIRVSDQSVSQKDLYYISIVCKNVFLARDLINEPGSELTSVEIANRITEMARKNKFEAEILHKSKIVALKMGGLLSINRGSKIPPTFSIIKWKPENAVNAQPLILVGKGIVFDTGGLSLKPTANSMDYMKSDMSGAAIVLSVISAIAELNLPVYVIGLIPATDNRPGDNAVLPGDVVRMYNGTTVEVLNTDAEGRMILADALSFAAQFKPDLVIDLATLTGAASVAIGKYAMVAFFKCVDDIKQQLILSGYQTDEKMVEFPLWNEYAELIKSDVADIKNIGGRDAGAITAAKFLEKFTSFPWIHLDIAGVSFSHSEYKYYQKGGTGFGIRVLLNFINKKYLTK